MATAPTPQVTYAGVPLLLPDERLQAYLDRHWRPGAEWQGTIYTNPGVTHLPRPYPPEMSRPKFGVLRWPTGATRWATYYGLADAQTLAEIQKVVTKDGQFAFSPLQVALQYAYKLTMSDGARSVDFPMYPLQPVPIASGLGNDLFVVPFVDRRYSWQYSGEYINDGFHNQRTIGRYWKYTPYFGSWTDLFNHFFPGFCLCASVTIDAIPSIYKTPSRRFNPYIEPRRMVYPLSIIADAAACTVGSAVIFGRDESVRVIRPENARAMLDAQYGQYETDRIAGGKVPAGWLGMGVQPAMVLIRPAVNDPIPDFLSFLGSIDAGSFPGNMYNPYNHFLGQSSSFIFADIDQSTPWADLGTAASQIASDWFAWKTMDVSACYQGIVPWQPTGMEDCLEWEASRDTCETRVIPPSTRDHNVYGAGMYYLPQDAWVLISPGGSDAAGYSGYLYTETSPGVWDYLRDSGGNAFPVSGIRRAPSNISTPDIPANQIVRVRARDGDGLFEIAAPGGEQSNQFSIWRYTMVSGNLIETPHTVTIKARDSSVSVS